MILDQYFFSGRNIPGYFVETGAQEHLGSYTWGMCGWEVQSPSRWAWAQGHVRILSATLLVSICLRSCLLSIPKETCRMIWSYLIHLFLFTFHFFFLLALQCFSAGYSSCSLGLPDAKGNRNLFTLTLVIPEEDAEALTGTAELAPAIIQGFQVGAP